MKSWTDLFIRRPVLAIVVNVIILVAGLQAWQNLSVRQYPRSENASVTVTTAYIGADAELVRGFITTPLERAIAAADGIDYIQSESMLGVSKIVARLAINYDANKALSEISSKIDQVRGDLPAEAEVPVINVESADSQIAAAYLSFASDFLEPNEVTDYLTRVVQPRLAALEGVQRAELLGGRTFAMRIWLKPEKMAAYSISPSEVRAALNNNNYLAAIGQTKGSLVQVNLRANTDVGTVEEFKDLVVREVNGTLIRLRDVANVELGAEEYDSVVRFSGKDAVFMGIWPLPNSNVIEVIERVRSELQNMAAQFPTGFRGDIAYDSTEYIRDSLKEVVKTLVETLAIVVLVIFLFLGSVRSVIIPVISIPLSLLGGVFLMQIFGFTLNLLTLLAIVLSVGLVVDDAIVVVENVERRLREGNSPLNAALLGTRELVAPVISMTITLVAVYVPIGLQGGLTGSLFREFAFTLAGAVLISGFVALTLSPMLSSRLLSEKREKSGFSGWLNRRFDGLRQSYGAALDAVLQTRGVVYAAWIFLTFLTIPMFLLSPTELAPTEDQGVIFGIVSSSANASIDHTASFTEEANRVFESVPEFAYSFQITFPSSGFGGMVVDPWGQRNRTIKEILPEVQMGLAAIPGIEMFPVLPPALPGGGDFPVEVVIASTAEPQQILEFAEKLKARAMEENLFVFPPPIDTK
ncbi:MAG: efflux RND transporter permease subunit, partial [Verrucomicrobiia bacterium]